MSATAAAVRVDKAVTSGTFSLDGGTWDVDNNVWLIGNDDECIVIDAAHDAAPILAAVAGRKVIAVLLTHGHDDHLGNAIEIVKKTNAVPVTLPEVAIHSWLPKRDLCYGGKGYTHRRAALRCAALRCVALRCAAL